MKFRFVTTFIIHSQKITNSSVHTMMDLDLNPVVGFNLELEKIQVRLGSKMLHFIEYIRCGCHVCM